MQYRSHHRPGPALPGSSVSHQMKFRVQSELDSGFTVLSTFIHFMDSSPLLAQSSSNALHFGGREELWRAWGGGGEGPNAWSSRESGTQGRSWASGVGLPKTVSGLLVPTAALSSLRHPDAGAFSWLAFWTRPSLLRRGSGSQHPELCLRRGSTSAQRKAKAAAGRRAGEGRAAWPLLRIRSRRGEGGWRGAVTTRCGPGSQLPGNSAPASPQQPGRALPRRPRALRLGGEFPQLVPNHPTSRETSDPATRPEKDALKVVGCLAAPTRI